MFSGSEDNKRLPKSLTVVIIVSHGGWAGADPSEQGNDREQGGQGAPAASFPTPLCPRCPATSEQRQKSWRQQGSLAAGRCEAAARLRATRSVFA